MLLNAHDLFDKNCLTHGLNQTMNLDNITYFGKFMVDYEVDFEMIECLFL